MKTDGHDFERKQMGTLVARPVAGARLDRFNRSVRVPAVPANREYLRALREAEMLAWEKATQTLERPQLTINLDRGWPL